MDFDGISINYIIRGKGKAYDINIIVTLLLTPLSIIAVLPIHMRSIKL